METFTQIYAQLAHYQYLILFPIVVIEGPIVSIVAGFIIAQGLMSFYIAFPLIVVADIFGDALYYALGRWGRKFGSKLFRVSDEKLKTLENYYKKNSGKAIITSKLAHGIGTVFLFAAGAAHMPFKKFLKYNILGTIPKSLTLLLIGYFYGQSVAHIGKYFDYFAIFTLVTGVILLSTYLIISKRYRSKEQIL